MYDDEDYLPDPCKHEVVNKRYIWDYDSQSRYVGYVCDDCGSEVSDDKYIPQSVREQKL